MTSLQKLNAIVFCEGGLDKPIGKTAHGLIRFSSRYNIRGVIDSTHPNSDAGTILDGVARGIPTFSNISEAVAALQPKPDVMVIGTAPTGHGDTVSVIEAAAEALNLGVGIHSGLHLFLGDIPLLMDIAVAKGLSIVDIRKPPKRSLRMFTGESLKLGTPKLLVMGQDAAAGKRTAAIHLSKELASLGVNACLIGTGQTAWLQGIDYGVRLDALPMDFAAGELESEILRADTIERPDLFIIEGQGSLLNPAYSGEAMVLLTSCRPEFLLYVTTPGRSCYVDFPEFEIAQIDRELSVIESIVNAKMVGFVINNSGAESSLCSCPGSKFDPVVVGPMGNFRNLAKRIVYYLDCTTLNGTSIER